MKLNNKGFAVSIILYSIIVVIILVLTLILSVYATNIRNKISLADNVKGRIIDKEVIDLDTLSAHVSINKTIPSLITKGDSYLIVGNYNIGQFGGRLSCSIDGDTVNNPLTANTSSLNVGSHNVVCSIILDGNTVAQDSREIVVSYVQKTITNLVTNGSFESGDSNWTLSNTTIVSGGYHGSKALRFNSGNSLSTQTLAIKPVIEHKYYGSLMFKSSLTFTATDDRYDWYNTEDMNGRMIFARKNMQVTNWTRISYVQSIDAETYLGTDWIIRNFVTNSNANSYADALILIDLTETFGSGSEPTRDWCDKHINYFDGTTTIYR